MTTTAIDDSQPTTLDAAPRATQRAAEIARNQKIRLFTEAQLGRNERERAKEATCASEAGPSVSADKPAIAASMRTRLRALWQETEPRHADLIALLIDSDAIEGWRAAGARSCVTWMNTELEICPQLAREKLRVGNALKSLPLIAELFAAGRLGWSKVRASTRIADADNERALAASALDMSAGGCVRMCAAFRWRRGAGDRDAEKIADAERFARRSLIWRETLRRLKRYRPRVRFERPAAGCEAEG